ncbi:MAG: cupin domain-containing protein [Pseudazoarcus pumilus]|nr:cupin domain-containing protein [Pseudazoarcus pumilus]
MNERDDHDALVDLFAPALGDSPPSAAGGMRERLLARAAASRARHAGQRTVRTREGAWRTLKAGVRAKTLYDGPHGSSVLIELAPGASLPPHRHRHLEEGIVLRGSMQMGELDLGPGDYHVSAPGSRHATITSRDGCLTYLRGSSLGSTVGLVIELLGGLLPGEGAAPITVTIEDGVWRPLADGVEEKGLWHDDELISRFLRFAPGASLPAVACTRDTEVQLVSGEVFCGDILLCQQDFHLLPAGTELQELSSDVGGVVFIHGRFS